MSTSVLYMSMSLAGLMATGSVLVGRRTFDIAGRWNGYRVQLELTRVIDAPGVTHLRYRVAA